MFDAGALTFQEFAMAEKLPLATIQRSVLEFLRGRKDAVVFGAQAVNAYVAEPRMTQDVDILSVRAADLAEELRTFLNSQFQIAVRIRKVSKNRGFRLYQVRKSGNRHLVDIRTVETLPSVRRVGGVQVVTPDELIANKVRSYCQRKGQPKSWSDRRDLAILFLTFPELKSEQGAVFERLKEASSDSEVLAVWRDLVNQEIQPEGEDDDFGW